MMITPILTLGLEWASKELTKKKSDLQGLAQGELSTLTLNWDTLKSKNQFKERGCKLKKNQI